MKLNTGIENVVSSAHWIIKENTIEKDSKLSEQ